jgi:hypothetical protein
MQIPYNSPGYPYAVPPGYSYPPPGYGIYGNGQKTGVYGQAPPPLQSMAALANAASFEIERQAEVDRQQPASQWNGPAETNVHPMAALPSPFPVNDARSALWHLDKPHAYLAADSRSPSQSPPHYSHSDRHRDFHDLEPDLAHHSHSASQPVTRNHSYTRLHRHAYNPYPQSAATSRHASPELPDREEDSVSPPPSGQAYPDGYEGSPVLAPFRGLSLLHQNHHSGSSSHSKSHSITPSLTPLNLSRPGSPVHLPALRLPESGGAASTEAELEQQHELPSHHHHAQRIHKSIGPYAGPHTKSRPGSPTFGASAFASKFHLEGDREEMYNLVRPSMSRRNSSEGSRPHSPPELSSSARSHLHGTLEDILNPTRQGPLTLPPLSSMTGDLPSTSFSSRVSHTRSAPGSRQNSPPPEPTSPGRLTLDKKGRSHDHLPSLGGYKYGAAARSTTRNKGFGKGFSFTPISLSTDPVPAAEQMELS